MDLTGAYHGSLAKSVKFFYNPTTALFEPIGYDLHKGAGKFDNFILIDLLQESGAACSYICHHKEWYFRFFKSGNGELNFNFIDKYIDYLIQFSNESFINSFLDIYNSELSNYNNAINKDFPRHDMITWVGAGFFVYDKNYLFNRAKLIKKRINSTNLKKVDISKVDETLFYEDYQTSTFPFLAETINCKNKNDKKKYFFAGKMSIKFDSSCKNIKFSSFKDEERIFELKENIRIMSNQNIFFKDKFENLVDNIEFIKVSENLYQTNSNIKILKNTIINKNQKIIFEKNSSIDILKGSTLFIEGQIEFTNDQNNLTVIQSDDGTGSLVFINNDYNLSNLIFKKLSKPNLENYILYGGVNFINSKVDLDNIYIKDSNNEDGINIINSKSNLTNIYFDNIKADAFDVDFGDLNFLNINCANVNNDCLDISGANVTGQQLFSDNVFDKGISVGEGSVVAINDIKISNNNVALAVKDGSNAYFKDVNLDNNNFDIVLFNKKKEFLKPSLKVENINYLDEKKILQSKDTKLFINNKKYLGNYKDNFIISKIY